MSRRNHVVSFAAVLLCGTGLSAVTIEDGKAQQVQSAYAYVTANLNQRAGPATRFPSLGVIPDRTQVRINGCLQDLTWCEGAVGDVRGWMSANYLRLYDYRQQAWVDVADYAGSTQLPRYTFDLNRYWAQHYSDRAFYPQRAAWLAPPTSPPIDRGVFYRELSPYGRWVSLDNQYVWMPNVRQGWRPYTDGRWEYTERYGWTWVSNEPFGWATYHYGRWAYSDRLGWVWQPGTQWAPAWVAWRGSEDHLAWAPLPPDAGPGYRVSEDFAEIPSYYWQVVPSQDFLQANLINVIIGNDNRERRNWLDRARPIGTATVVNNTVVNNVVNINYVEQKTRKKVVPREVVITNRDRPERADAGAPDEVVRIYQPRVAEAPASATPPAVLPASVAEKQSQTTGQSGDEPGTDTRLAETPPVEEAVAPPTEAPPLAPEEAADQPAQAPAEEQPAVAPPDDQPAQPSAEEPAAPPPQDNEPQAAPADGTPPAEEEPPPPADQASPTATGQDPAPPPPATDEAAPPPPEPDAPPAPAAEEPAPPPPAAEEAAPPPAPDEAAPPPPEPDAPPPPAAEEPSPPPPAAEEAAPPPAPGEAAPPPPAAAAEEPPPPAQAAPAAEPAKSGGKNGRKAKDCPDGERLNNKGECVARKK